jgi:transcription elongation factor B subunit 1
LLTPRRPLLIRPKQVIKYFYYKLRYANEPMPPEFPIEPSMALELLMAANYLDA